ncbi:MAG: heme lyase CcmF/NrfE family subunit, partial [Steroidobacteraceae bacterium]|nr:heme lyase CcmF/NrfE family subunit [Steroidobacteraceae bacterium]MDW8258980.1 heme lyase CcmF/NrfE family subunit [Gammaproteobacteria bacterium]
GPALGRERWALAAQPAAIGQAALLGIALALLINAFVQHDFSVKYVAENSNTALPTLYRVAAVWGAHEGSMLLWSFVLALWTVAVVVFSRSLPVRFLARVLGVLGLVSAGFLLFTLLTSNPFERLIPAAPDGRDLNPLLQDPALAAHPPMLYAGYVGFSVAFAFACAAMLEGRLDQTWARWTRPWTTVAWALLTVGIALGSWWAYYELGWGGYWFWDPVENASFMPWLIGTALIHSLAVTDKRGLFKSWTLLLAILAFSLSLLGTFLVRSGVLVSVHSFAADPARGVFILAFLIVAIGGALALYAWRAPALKSSAGFELSAREAFLLFNNILLVIACATVFAGTMAPLISDALGLGTLSVGTQYFNPVFLLPMLPLLALVAVGMHAGWKKGRLREKRRVLLGTLALAAALTLAALLGVFGRGVWLTPLGLLLGSGMVLSALADPLDRLRRRLSLSPSVIGMTVAHVGLGIFVVAITVVESFTHERDVALRVGERAPVGPYEYRLQAIEPIEGANYDGIRATVVVTRDGRELAVLRPEKRQYWVQRSVMTEAGIRTAGGRNLFAAIGEDLGAGRWSIRAQVRPLVNWVWWAAALMALGGVVAATDRRYRKAVAAPAAQAITVPR